MPRFFLNIRDGANFIEDPDGSVLPDIEAACHEALSAARDILAERLRAGDLLSGLSFEITDKAAITRAVVPMTLVLRLG